MAWLTLLIAELAAIYTIGRYLSSALLSWTLRQSAPARMLGWALMAPGTFLHELSHALVVICLGGRISAFVPFRPRQEEDRVQLGYVEHSGVRLGPLGGAMVGMAPLVGIPAAIWGLGLLMVPISGSPLELLAWVADHPLSLGAAWLLISIPLSLGALPSASDHRDLPLAGILLAVLLAGLYFLGALTSLSFLEMPLTGWAQLLIFPAVVSLIGFVPLLRRFRLRQPK